MTQVRLHEAVGAVCPMSEEEFFRAVIGGFPGMLMRRCAENPKPETVEVMMLRADPKAPEVRLSEGEPMRRGFREDHNRGFRPLDLSGRFKTRKR